MWHLECSNDRRRITLPVLILRAAPEADLTGHHSVALLDTGATTSGITQNVVRALDLVGMGKRPIGFAQGDGLAERYLFRIGLSSNADRGSAAFPFVFEAVMGFGLAGTFHFDVLLGMDILSQCNFKMDRSGRAVLSFG